jgi:prepilin-type processing-associated H-X9-DG protein
VAHPSNNGEVFVSPNQLTGAFNFGGMRVAFLDVTDGLTNTIPIGESLPGEHGGGGGAWASSFSGYANSTTNIPINTYTPPADWNRCAQYGDNIQANGGCSMGFKSRHVGGANFVFGDGTVQSGPEGPAAKDYLRAAAPPRQRAVRVQYHRQHAADVARAARRLAAVIDIQTAPAM